jgi:hypothetical protein
MAFNPGLGTGAIKNSFGRPFRAHLRWVPYPGLKPPAVLFSHFVAYAGHARYAHTPLRSQYFPEMIQADLRPALEQVAFGP